MAQFINEIVTHSKQLYVDKDPEKFAILLSMLPEGAEKSLIKAEHNWRNVRRPYFNVYPKVLNALAKTSLRVKPSQIPKSVFHDLSVMAIKFPNNHDVKLLKGLDHMFISLIDEVRGRGIGGIACYYTLNDAVYYSAIPQEDYVDEMLKIEQEPDEFEIRYASQNDEERARTNLASRIMVGVLMLAADEEYIAPILIRGDADKAKTEDDVKRLADKARRRGLVGYDIGRDIEVSPHIRMPHFGLRWTGEGRKIPKIVPIKGSVINKKLVAEVPTGYEDDSQEDS